MTTLLSSLDRMLSWVDKYLPEYAQSFQPGLTQAAVQAAIVDIQYAFPSDYYELYQWRNGTPDESIQSLGPVFYFLPLEEALEYRDWLLQKSPSSENDWIPQYQDCPVLPLIKSNCEYHALVLGRDYENEAHIVLLDEVGDAKLIYDSITSMIESIADCFETQAYYLNEQGFIEENKQLSVEVMSKKNPKAVNEVVSSIQTVLEIYILGESLNQEDFRDGAKVLARSLDALRSFRSSDVVHILQELLLRIEQNRNRAPERSKHAYHTIRRWLATENVP